MLFDKLVKDIEDYGPLKVRLWDGFDLYLVAKHPSKNGFIGYSRLCSKIKPKEYFIRYTDIDEILD